MINTLVLLNPADLPAATQIAAQQTDCRILVLDPSLVDRATTSRIGPVEYMMWDSAPAYRERADEAHRQSRLLGAALDAATEPIWPGLALGSWQHLSLYYLHMALQWHKSLFAELAPRLEGRKLLIPFTDQPQSYYFPSFVPALMLLLEAQRRGLPFQAYTHSNKGEVVQRVPNLAGRRQKGERDFLLTHLPTCFYDAGYINNEIKTSGLDVVDLVARYWHVPLVAGTTITPVDEAAMQAELSDTDQARIDQVLQALRAPIDAHLATWITAPAYRTRQVDQLLAVYRAQLKTLALLHQHFEHAPPRRLLLSDHDTDFHGPLAAFARHRQVPLLVLPHSKASTDMDFVCENATVLYHAVQGDTVYDVAGHRPAQSVIDLPNQIEFNTAAPAGVKRLGLLLNGVALNGVPGVDLAAYTAGIRRIVQWCDQQGLELVVRSRPGQTIFESVLRATGLSMAQMLASTQGSMADFAQRCDLCLMYDAPTSGALECLQRAVPTLNPVAGTLTKRETGSMNDAIVPRADIEVTLRYAAQMVADPIELQRFRLQQFLQFVARLREAQPLRAFL